MIDKKSHNPFKMKGSWIGAILGLLGLPFLGFANPNIFFRVYAKDIFEIDLYFLPLTILNFALGFFIGWMVHSLIRKISFIRKFRKKNKYFK